MLIQRVIINFKYHRTNEMSELREHWNSQLFRVYIVVTFTCLIFQNILFLAKPIDSHVPALRIQKKPCSVGTRLLIIASVQQRKRSRRTRLLMWDNIIESFIECLRVYKIQNIIIPMGTVTLGPYFSEPITMTVTLKICQKERLK